MSFSDSVLHPISSTIAMEMYLRMTLAETIMN